MRGFDAVISIPAWRGGGGGDFRDWLGLGTSSIDNTPSHGVASTDPSSNKLCLGGWARWSAAVGTTTVKMTR